MPNETRAAAEGKHLPLGNPPLRGLNRPGLTPSQLQAAERVVRAHADRLLARLRQLSRDTDTEEIQH